MEEVKSQEASQLSKMGVNFIGGIQSYQTGEWIVSNCREEGRAEREGGLKWQGIVPLIPGCIGFLRSCHYDECPVNEAAVPG